MNTIMPSSLELPRGLNRKKGKRKRKRGKIYRSKFLFHYTKYGIYITFYRYYRYYVCVRSYVRSWPWQLVEEKKKKKKKLVRSIDHRQKREGMRGEKKR